MPALVAGVARRVALLPHGNIVSMSLQDGNTVQEQGFSGTGQLLDTWTYDLTKTAPTFTSVERAWPCELFVDAARSYTYWNQWLVVMDEIMGPIAAHELSGTVVQLARSPYTAELQLAVATQTGLQVWEPENSAKRKPTPEIATNCAANMDLRFVARSTWP
ncbi:hypothetical protein [Hymenobacter cellulosilyticus]|uniref:Uncharacterized protein n=1 Tax=Hymenobacter cellulosilyticus TaxID=2932248 RepID=A0A8T9Q0Q0_9BACT|nr:hypothetical protein [Hymenobacter cellulosilyticus]UOQ70452.1 hypothetical protein MUN79_17135 [Hymenobacter cellulosilyticus]